MLSAAARVHDGGGALNFAFYFFSALDWSFATNDTYLLRRSSAASCTACNELATGIEMAERARTTIRGGRVVLRSVRVDSRHYNVHAERVFDVAYLQTKATTVTSQGIRAPVAGTGATRNGVLFLDWSSRGWVVTHLTNEAGT